ncbi:MAG: carboxy-S-adenosyl-L-methionine synthase CmoA [Planctomycetaceae bacterium]
MKSDRIYSVPLDRIGDFEFDDAVADVFPDMIRRSVPGYASMLSMIAQAAERFAVPRDSCLRPWLFAGSGHDAVAAARAPGCHVVAVDSSASMIQRLKDRLKHDDEVVGEGTAGSLVSVQQADIRDVSISDASLVVLNLTLQFLPPQDRTGFLKNVADGTREGGALVLSEKICFDDPTQQELMTQLHHDFKRAHGYSDLEIAQKRTAIENRLIPETIDTHVQRLRDCGYGTVAPWFQCFNFASILAVK